MNMKTLSKVYNYFLICYVAAQIKFWEVSDKVKALRSEDNRIVDEVIESYNKPKEG